MFSYSVTKQAEEALEEVLRVVREDYADPFPVLSEMDRKRFVEEEERLRNQLKEALESELSRSSLRGLFGLSSPQALKCLQDARELRRCVKEDVNAKLRTKLSGKSIPPFITGSGQDPSRMPETDAGCEPANATISSPLNMRCSLSEPGFSDAIVSRAVQNDHDYTSDINEAINSTLEMSNDSSDRSRDPSNRRPRRSPPLPSPRRVTLSNSSRSSSETSSSSASDSSSRPCVSRSATPPTLTTNVPFPSAGSSYPHTALIPISNIADQMSARGGGRSGRRNFVYKTNCLEFSGSSNSHGTTMNNGGTKNSGSVIHMMAPPSS